MTGRLAMIILLLGLFLVACVPHSLQAMGAAIDGAYNGDAAACSAYVDAVARL